MRRTSSATLELSEDTLVMLSFHLYRKQSYNIQCKVNPQIAVSLQDYNLGLLLHKTPNIGRPTPNYNKSQHVIVTNFAMPDFD